MQTLTGNGRERVRAPRLTHRAGPGLAGLRGKVWPLVVNRVRELRINDTFLPQRPHQQAAPDEQQQGGEGQGGSGKATDQADPEGYAPDMGGDAGDKD